MHHHKSWSWCTYSCHLKLSMSLSSQEGIGCHKLNKLNVRLVSTNNLSNNIWDKRALFLVKHVATYTVSTTILTDPKLTFIYALLLVFLVHSLFNLHQYWSYILKPSCCYCPRNRTGIYRIWLVSISYILIYHLLDPISLFWRVRDGLAW